MEESRLDVRSEIEGEWGDPVLLSKRASYAAFIGPAGLSKYLAYQEFQQADAHSSTHADQRLWLAQLHGTQVTGTQEFRQHTIARDFC